MDERLALDSFVSFEWSQFYPTHYHVLVGRESHYFVGFTDSEVRRSGHMTSGQKRRRQELEATFGRPNPRSIEMEVAALLRCTVPAGKSIDLTTDEHDDYPRALRRARPLAITHHTISSRAARNVQNPLFAVNLLDLLIRHSSANHKRETIAFSRRRRSAIERLWLFLVWRNYVKAFSERRGGGTPAQRAGVTTRRWKMRELFRRRLFPDRVGLPRRWRDHFEGRVRTRVLDAS